MLRIAIILFFLVINTYGYCQDLSGKWYGNYAKSFLGSDVDELVIELELYNDSLIKGTSKLFYGRNNYEYYVLKGVYRKFDSTIFFSEVSEIEVRLGTLNSNVMGNYTMKLKDYGGVLRFEGKWRSNEPGLLQRMGNEVWIQKLPPLEKTDRDEILNDKPLIVQPPAITKRDIKPGIEERIVTKIKPVDRSGITADKPRVVLPPDTNLKRNTIINKNIAINSVEQDSIRIEIIDNAKIDGDVISVYVNDRLVRHKQAISEVPVVFYVSIDKTVRTYTIKVAAESYGSMPPCTSHITVYTRNGKHEFDLQSYFNDNAAFTLEAE